MKEYSMKSLICLSNTLKTFKMQKNTLESSNKGILEKKCQFYGIT